MEDILDSLRSEREREIYLQRSDENKIGERPGAELKHIERERWRREKEKEKRIKEQRKLTNPQEE